MSAPPAPAAQTTVTLGDVVDRIVARAGTVVACVVLFGLLAVVLGTGRPDVYETTAVVTVAPLSTQPFDDPAGQVNIATEREVVRSTAVASRVSERLPDTPSPSTLTDSVLVTAPNNSQVMEITVSAGTPVAAAERANGFAEAYLAVRQEDADEVARRFIANLEARADELREQIEEAGSSDASILSAQQQLSELTDRVNDLETVALNPGRVISPAEPPTSPSSPGPAVYLAAGLLLGGIVGILLALVRDRVDRTVHDPRRLGALLTGETLIDADVPDDPAEPYRRAMLVLQRDPVYAAGRGQRPDGRDRAPVIAVLGTADGIGAPVVERLADVALVGGGTPLVVSAAEIDTSEVDHGWPDRSARDRWSDDHDLVVIDATTVTSESRRLVLAQRADLAVLLVPAGARTSTVEEVLDGMHEVGTPPRVVLAVPDPARSRRSGRDRGPSSAGRDTKVLLVASAGGHLTQLLALRGFWEGRRRRWVTFDKPDAQAALVGEKVTWAFHPTTRNPWNAIRNTFLAVWDLLRDRPRLIVSSGAAVAVPYFLVARVLRIRTVYIEVIDRIDSPTLSGRICYRLADAFCVQWEQQLELYPDAVVIGPTL